jgi:protein-L-isoaspartate(D-aspartate) O-methyltransferase
VHDYLVGWKAGKLDDLLLNLVPKLCRRPYLDLVISINTLHNLSCRLLEKSLREIERVGRKNKYVCVESYRNEEEKVNLLYWQLTCLSFYSPDDWLWWHEHTGYTGDYSFIFFE